MLKGFKDFLMKGNLVELAVALIMALAFAEVVNATVGMIMDLIGKAGGTPNFSEYEPGGISVGVFLTALVSFLIVAAVVYFLIIVPYTRLKERMAEEEGAEPSPEAALLAEIRDLLAVRNQSGSAPGS
ncbi:MAG: large conductance mechanosensitive channel protein MscL [Propionibacteriales bacterium]|nr:large conductance mechanosensitive channel protein MscL [Propionibacteriales bacterium]